MLINNFKKILFITVFTVFLSISYRASAVSRQPFEAWLGALKEEAAQSGISSSVISMALDNIRPVERIIELDRKQPEGRMSFAKYRQNIVNDSRINKGRALMQEHAVLLAAVNQKYGVAPQYIVALWAIETNFGQNTGGFDVVTALATLAWDGRRAAFFRKELLTALQILDQGHITHENMRGSWAGAMGQNQFMPSSFNSYAVDYNEDNKKDIWTSLPDIFASSSNYLSRNGWKTGQRWGRAVSLPEGFSDNLVGLEIRKPLAEWSKAGVTRPGGGALPVDNMQASLVAPDGMEGPVFLVYDNYRTIMTWNRSTYFATSVGLLANAIIQ